MSRVDLGALREEYAEVLMAGSPVKSEPVRAAFARVPRECFCGPPPWGVFDASALGQVEQTSEPARLYRDVLVSIDAGRQLNNGSPGLWFAIFAALELAPGAHVLQIGVGLGYYSALLGELVGPDGRVTAVELDPGLASQARANLAQHWPQVEVTSDTGIAHPETAVDAIVLFAGATHVPDAWLDGLVDGGRLFAPLTFNPNDPFESLGVGVGARITRRGEAFEARALTPIGIYPCLGARERDANAALQAAVTKGGQDQIRSLRRDPHEPDADCWCHVPGRCLSRAPVI